MSQGDSKFACVAGFVLFEPDAVDVGEQSVRRAKVRALGSQKLVRVTLWPEHAQVPLDRGDFIAVEGKWTATEAKGSDGVERTYYDISAANLVRLQAAPKQDVASARDSGLMAASI